MKEKLEQLKSLGVAAKDRVSDKTKVIAPRFSGLKQSYKVVIVIITVVVLWMLSGVVNFKAKNHETPPEQVMVKVVESVAISKEKFLRLSATTKASKVIELKAEAEGLIEEIPAKKGQFLKKGDPIAQIDKRNTAKQLEQAQAEYNKQLISYNSTKAAYDKKLSSEYLLADATQRLKSAENTLQSAKDEIAKTVILAPEDGFLDNVYVEIGDFVAVMQSSKIATFLVLNPIQVIAYVPEKNIHEAQESKSASIELTDKSVVTGDIVFLSKNSDPATRTYKLEIDLPNEGSKINSGQTVKVMIPLSAVTAHHVPKSSLELNMKGEVSIKIVGDESKVSVVPVELIDEDEDGFWITGLPERAKIVTLGHQYVKDGELVIINAKDI